MPLINTDLAEEWTGSYAAFDGLSAEGPEQPSFDTSAPFAGNVSPGHWEVSVAGPSELDFEYPQMSSSSQAFATASTSMSPLVFGNIVPQGQTIPLDPTL